MRSLAALLAVAILVGCTGTSKAVDPVCKALVEKIDQCDPSAKEMPASTRKDLLANCPRAQRPCASLDTSTAQGCQRFMGCLYDGS